MHGERITRAPGVAQRVHSLRVRGRGGATLRLGFARGARVDGPSLERRRRKLFFVFVAPPRRRARGPQAHERRVAHLRQERQSLVHAPGATRRAHRARPRGASQRDARVARARENVAGGVGVVGQTRLAYERAQRRDDVRIRRDVVHGHVHGDASGEPRVSSAARRATRRGEYPPRQFTASRAARNAAPSEPGSFVPIPGDAVFSIVPVPVPEPGVRRARRPRPAPRLGSHLQPEHLHARLEDGKTRRVRPVLFFSQVPIFHAAGFPDGRGVDLSRVRQGVQLPPQRVRLRALPGAVVRPRHRGGGRAAVAVAPTQRPPLSKQSERGGHGRALAGQAHNLREPRAVHRLERGEELGQRPPPRGVLPQLVVPHATRGGEARRARRLFERGEEDGQTRPPRELRVRATQRLRARDAILDARR